MTEPTRCIEGLELPAPARTLTHEAPPTFGPGPQALVIGSQMTEFTGEVPQSMRLAISQGRPLGQLATGKATAGPDDPWAWSRTYTR